MKAAIVILNIYHFFIRKQAFFTCLAQLAKFSFFDPGEVKAHQTLSKDQISFMVETILLGYMIGLTFMPGGHQQMQYLDKSFVPLLILMTGFPTVLIFWTYQLVFPCIHLPNFVTTEYQEYTVQTHQVRHIFNLALVIYLITIGPDALRKYLLPLWSSGVEAKAENSLSRKKEVSRDKEKKNK